MSKTPNLEVLNRWLDRFALKAALTKLAEEPRVRTWRGNAPTSPQTITRHVVPPLTDEQR